MFKSSDSLPIIIYLVFLTFNVSLLDCSHFWASSMSLFNFSSRVAGSLAERVREISSAYISTDDDNSHS